MKVEAKLKRTPSKKIAEQQARTNSHFPSVWNLQCFAYGSLKFLIRDFETNKAQQDHGTKDQDWELSFSSMLEAEITKINSFYEERHNECVDGLKGISLEIPTVCSMKSAGNIQVWHEFIVQYNSKVKILDSRGETLAQFIIAMEGYLLLAGKSIEQPILNIVRKLVYIHKLSLQLKHFAQFNVTGIKNLLKKHDEKISASISTSWMERIRGTSFGSYDCFEKIVGQTKDLIRSLTPSTDDFACAVCLGLLCEPVAVQCGHRFCEQCLIIASASCSFCPMCRTEQQLHPSNHTPDKQLKQYLKQFFASDYKASRREHKNAKKKSPNCTIS